MIQKIPPYIYEPREDSFLLEKYVKEYATGRVLEVGTGSAIQTLAAAKLKNVARVLAVDINPKVVKYCRDKIKEKKIERVSEKITFKVSDLFSKVSGKFDTIIFNPPYLPFEPLEPEESRYATTGGKHGYETLQKFLSVVNDYLSVEGKILVVFSSLTKRDRVDLFIAENGLVFKELEMEKIPYEELYVYVIEKSWLLKELERKKVTNISKFMHGRRGVIYKAKYNGKTVVIKCKKPESKAIGNIKRESEWLKILNKKKIGPQLIFVGKGYFVYDFLPGIFIRDFLESVSKKDKTLVKKVFLEVFNQCFIMDKLGINKEEMHNPYKHVIVDKEGKVGLVDFERATRTENPKNVTQFCQYVMRNKKILDKIGFKIDRRKIISRAKKYKRDMSKERFKDILDIIKK